MAFLGDVAGGPNTPLVILTFLQQTGCGNSELRQELDSLDRELKHIGDIHCNGRWKDIHDDGELQTDGHFCSNIREALGDMQPQLEWPMNPADAAALRNVAVGLIEIADQLERNVMAQAAENLATKLQKSPFHRWKDYLTLEVEWVVKQGLGTGLEQLPQERVIVALTLTLVKGVCERAPRLLRNLFATAIQYINPAMAS